MEGTFGFARFGTGSPFSFRGTDSPSFRPFEPTGGCCVDGGSLSPSDSMLGSMPPAGQRADCRNDMDGEDSLPFEEYDDRP